MMVRRAAKRASLPAWLALFLAAIAAGGTWRASIGSIRGWWSVEQALWALPAFFAIALIATALGLYSRFRRKRGGQMIAVAATLLSLCVAGFLAGERIRWDSHPDLHDITTNLDDPPSFTAIPIRRDLISGVPVTNRPGWQTLTPQERWKAVHAEHYPGLHSHRSSWDSAEAIRQAEGAARYLGWKVVRADPGAGALEAVATSRFLGFKDDIAVRARPDAEGGSIVDVRSVSRQGVSDHGRGAAHIRRFSLALDPPH